LSTSGTAPIIASFHTEVMAKLAGRGLDCDLSSDNPTPLESRMSRLDNLSHPLSRGMITAALICGVLVALISFLTIKDESLERKNWLGLAVALVVLVIASGFVSLFITMLHVPSGH
jgi:type III secretory pathway component EscS